MEENNENTEVVKDSEQEPAEEKKTASRVVRRSRRNRGTATSEF